MRQAQMKMPMTQSAWHYQNYHALAILTTDKTFPDFEYVTTVAFSPLFM